MKIENQSPESNYVKEIARLVEADVLKRGEVSLVDVAHDDWCGVYDARLCDCDPEIIDRMTGEVLNRREGQRAVCNSIAENANEWLH